MKRSYLRRKPQPDPVTPEQASVMLAGDELYGDEVTSGPIEAPEPPDDRWVTVPARVLARQIIRGERLPSGLVYALVAALPDAEPPTAPHGPLPHRCSTCDDVLGPERMVDDAP